MAAEKRMRRAKIDGIFNCGVRDYLSDTNATGGASQDTGAMSLEPAQSAASHFQGRALLRVQPFGVKSEAVGARTRDLRIKSLAMPLRSAMVHYRTSDFRGVFVFSAPARIADYRQAIEC